MLHFKIKFPHTEELEKIRLVYRNGYTHELWVKDLEHRNGLYSWTHAYDDERVLEVVQQEIIAIFVIKKSTRIIWN